MSLCFSRTNPFFKVLLEYLDLVFIFDDFHVPFPNPFLVDANTDCIFPRAADAAARGGVARGARDVAFILCADDDDIILLLSSQNC